MKHRLFVFIFCTIIAPQIAEAQYSFTISHYTTGNCNIGGYNFDSYWRALGSRWPDGGYFGPFNTLSSCESARQYILTIPDTYNINTGSCRIHYGATPCTGFSVGSVDYGNSNDIILGVSKGRSFYSPNSLEQILNWEKDDEQRQKALNYDYETYTEAQYINTGNENFNKEREKERNGWYLDTDKPFRSLNIDEKGGINTHSRDLGPISLKDEFDKVAMAQDFSSMANKENVERYVDFCNNLHLADLFTNLDHPFEGDLTMLLHQKFKDASGFDVDAIMQKLPSERTEAEKQALIDYQEFRKQVTENIIKEIDNTIAHKEEIKYFEMAALSENCYKDSDHAFLSRTNYKKVDTDFFEENTPMKNLSALIDDCNSTNSETGFHAEIYYNEKTNEYTIAFEGTNFDEWNDVGKTDLLLALGMTPEQYKKANRIADFLSSPNFPSDIKINITGHSLGGGLASIVGLKTGKPTYTYNAAGLNKSNINEFGLTEKINNNDTKNIKAFQSNQDPLTSAQEGELKANIIVGTTIICPQAGAVLTAGATTGHIGAPTVGNKETVWNYSGDGSFLKKDGHKIVPMVSYLAGPVSQYESIKNNIYEKGHHVEYQTQETILIYTGE